MFTCSSCCIQVSAWQNKSNWKKKQPKTCENADLQTFGWDKFNKREVFVLVSVFPISPRLPSLDVHGFLLWCWFCFYGRRFIACEQTQLGGWGKISAGGTLWSRETLQLWGRRKLNSRKLIFLPFVKATFLRSTFHRSALCCPQTAYITRDIIATDGGNRSSSVELAVTITNVKNQPPRWEKDSYSVIIPENTPRDTPIVVPQLIFMLSSLVFAQLLPSFTAEDG